MHYEPIGYDVFAEMLTAIGIGPHLVQHLRHVSHDIQRGVFAGPTTSWHAFIDQHRAQFTP